jgi:DNA mismatch repair protein MutL
MSKIRILPSLIAERIAAGEVIERPASVVKELCENSIDAGATAIEVTLKRGGTDLIEIVDNGSGMERADLEICIGRHATSKIREFDDLARLQTLGFRGEALPSIASVSELSIASRARDSDETHEIHLSQSAADRVSANRIANIGFLGSPHGTRVRVASLFSQIPARLKFLKSPGAEGSAVREILERLALTHPAIAFKLKNEDRCVLDLPPEPLRDRAIRLLSGDNPFEVKETNLEGAYGIQVIWLKGLSLPHTRSMYQIVNGRALRDRTLQMAILNPLKQSFLPGNFPACVVNLTVPGDELDVNVHPSKTEIRFLDSGKIFALCNAAFAPLLSGERPIADFHSSPFAFQGGAARPASFQPDFPSRFTSDFRGAYTPMLSLESGEAPSGAERSGFIDETPIGDYRGVLFSTYFVFERGDDLTLIDQHAAHERIRYEHLKARILKNEKIETQTLLVPEVVKFPLETLLELREKLPVLEPLGFDAEIFGEEAILFRAVPAVWGNRSLTERLRNLLERLVTSRFDPKSLVWDETLFEKIAMEACRSSFKAGDGIPELSALDLTRKLYQCDHPGNCPHGRPTSIRITKTKVEEWFNRLS